jgi:hypothetical protein
MCINMTFCLETKLLTCGNHCKESRGMLEIHVSDRICLFFLRPSWRLLKDATLVVQVSCIRLSNIQYRGADKSLARPTSRCILFDGENISFDASLVLCIYSTNIPPIMIINRVYETQNLLSL